MASLFRPNKCQYNFIRQIIITMYLEMFNSPHGKPMADYCVPFGKQKNFQPKAG